jgi:plastocyanin
MVADGRDPDLPRYAGCMKTVPLTAVTLVLLLPNCGGDGPEPKCADPVATTSVELADFAFRPDCLTMEAGSAVTLENTGDALHTFTVNGTDVDFELDEGTSTEASLSGVEPGTYAVTCTLHPQMTATLTVT